MRELTTNEVSQVSGGNPALVVGAYWVVQTLGAAGAGYFGGELINSFNAKVTKMSFSEAVKRTIKYG